MHPFVHVAMLDTSFAPPFGVNMRKNLQIMQSLTHLVLGFGHRQQQSWKGG